MKTTRLYIINLIHNFIPETRFFGLKRSLYRWAGIKIGTNVRICSSCHIIGSGNLIIEDNVWIGPHCFISTMANTTICSDVNIAPRVSIIDGSHYIDSDGSSIAGEGYALDIKIGRGCWICASSTILGGSFIGDQCIVAAGAITKGVYNSRLLLGGCIARRLKAL